MRSAAAGLTFLLYESGQQADQGNTGQEPKQAPPTATSRNISAQSIEAARVHHALPG